MDETLLNKIKTAMAMRQCIGFYYKGEGYRRCAPCLYGTTTRGNEAVMGFQLSGFSHTVERGWKNFFSNRMSKVRLINWYFDETTLGYRGANKAFANVAESLQEGVPRYKIIFIMMDYYRDKSIKISDTGISKLETIITTAIKNLGWKIVPQLEFRYAPFVDINEVGIAALKTETKYKPEIAPDIKKALEDVLDMGYKSWTQKLTKQDLIDSGDISNYKIQFDLGVNQGGSIINQSAKVRFEELLRQKLLSYNDKIYYKVNWNSRGDMQVTVTLLEVIHDKRIENTIQKDLETILSQVKPEWHLSTSDFMPASLTKKLTEIMERIGKWMTS